MTDDIKRVTNTIIFVQCAGQIGASAFDNGFMLNFLSKIGFGSEAVMYLLALPTIMMTFICLPAAYVSDRKGKKMMGAFGLTGVVAGFVMITVGCVLPSGYMIAFVTAGITLYSVGMAAYGSSWFALLSPLVPVESRGRFFGKLRVSFQIVALTVTWAVFYIIDRNDSMPAYFWIMVFVTGASAVRVVYYLKIPEKEASAPGNMSFRESLTLIMRTRGFFTYSFYCFALMLLTGALPWLSSLLAKDVLGFSAGRIVLLGNMLLAGTLTGYFAGGKLCDKKGTGFIFSSCHVIFLVVLTTMFFRGSDPGASGDIFLAAVFILGFARAAISIAVTSKMLAVLPSGNKSFSSSIITTMLNLGTSLSAVISGRMVTLNIFSEKEIMGRPMSGYDTMILIILVSLVVLSVAVKATPFLSGAKKRPAAG